MHDGHRCVAWWAERQHGVGTNMAKPVITIICLILALACVSGCSGGSKASEAETATAQKSEADLQKTAGEQ